MCRFWLVICLVVVCNVLLSACCPQRCRCDERRKIVYCNERNLVRIPYGIPSDTKVLLLQGNFIENSPSLESALGSLDQLERLDMHENKLTSFPNNLPKSLTYLSLRSNLIKFIGRDVFFGLVNLKELQLDSNNITNRGIGLNAFVDAIQLEDLALSQNALVTLPEGLPSNLKSLRLANNKITSVSSIALQPLQNLFVLDLSNNQVEGELGKLNQLSVLKTLDLNHNLIHNIPPNLPSNLTELHLAANKIQYIYTHRGIGHGDLQNLHKLRKLDLSSNRLRSIEKGSFSALPSTLSIELQDNPWGCDCNLAYLKQWLTFTSSVLASNDGIKCATPLVFSGVTLEAIDSEALQCTHSPYVIKTSQVGSTKAVVEYDVKNIQEPPYVTYSLMYGAMLCKDCALRGGISDTESHSSARMWMDDYTIVSITPNVPTEIRNLERDTRYAVCIVTSYQHPDQIGIEQCDDFLTHYFRPTSSSPVKSASIPYWVKIVGAVAGGLLLALVIIAIAVLIRRYVRKSTHSRFMSRHPNLTNTSTSYTPGGRRALINANPEFDVTLMVRRDLKHQSDSCCSDSHDESLATTQTGTMTSGNSNHLLKYEGDIEGAYLTPNVFLPTDNACANSRSDSGSYFS